MQDKLFKAKKHGNGYIFDSFEVQDLPPELEYEEMTDLYQEGNAKEFYLRMGLEESELQMFYSQRDNS